MDASGRCSERLQVPERSRDTATVFLCAAAAEFLRGGGLVYSNAAEPGDDGHGLGPRSTRVGWQSCSLRDDHAAGAGGSLDVAAHGGRDSSWRFGRVGAGTCYYRIVRRDVL